MTLIVGILCKDGVVLGADSAATFGVPGLSTTILQPTAKLQNIHDSILIGVSGPVGLGQQFVDRISSLDQGRLFQANPVEVGRIVSESIRQDVRIALEIAALAQQVIPGAGQAALTATLLALPTAPAQDKPALIQFDYQCNPEVATENLPFVSVGSGQPIADPFLAFVRHIFWPNALPSLADGIFATVWTLEHAIRTAPAYIAGPKQVAILERQERKRPGTTFFAVRSLDRSELQEHEQNVEEAENYLARWKDLLTQGSDVSSPPAPPQSAS